jgi:WD40 repeat protein
MASGANDIVIWEGKTLTKAARLEQSSEVFSLAFSPDSRWLVSAHGDGAILLWDAVERERVGSLNGHSAPVNAVAFAPDGTMAASAGDDRAVILWDLRNGMRKTLLGLQETRIAALAFSPDGTKLVSACQTGEILVWDVAGRKQAAALEHPVSNYCAAWSPDGRWIALTQGVHEAASGRLAVGLKNDPRWRSGYYGMGFSRDGRFLACAAPAGFLDVWNTADWSLAASRETGDSMQVRVVAFAPDGKLLATGDNQGDVRLWNLQPLQEVRLLGSHVGRVKSIAFSPDSAEILTAGDDGTMRLWSTTGRGSMKHLGSHTAGIAAIAFSPDGKRLLSGEADRSVRLYSRHRMLWSRQLD